MAWPSRSSSTRAQASSGKARAPPDADHPGANFDRATYEETAQLPNDQFIERRNKVLDAAPDGELQRSFYSNGCTAIPADTISQQTMDACIQHDFRYTVGPNVDQDDPEAADRERKEAGKQLGDNIGGRAGDLFNAGTQVAGSYFFQPTDTGEQNASELLP
ncbi:hypothetical protein [Streptomyces sp. PR69]|uniref:hypothetical protein n=1 Tax=Streptomyces sp. PR69 TaxID=2984950 RepID=UPI00226559C4|nr:hypothetical protein [Streptomyces sp. PR69]